MRDPKYATWWAYGGGIIMICGVLLYIFSLSCAQVEISSLAVSKLSWQSLEEWNAHSMGKFSQEVKAGTMDDEDWQKYKWHRGFRDELQQWKNMHFAWLRLAGKESYTPEEEQELLYLYGQLTDLIIRLVEDAKQEGYQE